MADAVSRRIVISVQRVEPEVRAKHAGAGYGYSGALKVCASQRVGNITGHVYTLRFQLGYKSHVAWVDVDEWKEQVCPLVAYIGDLNDGVLKRFELKSQIPILRIRHLAAGSGPTGGVTGNSQALQKNQSIRIVTKNRIESTCCSLQRWIP